MHETAWFGQSYSISAFPSLARANHDPWDDLASAAIRLKVELGEADSQCLGAAFADVDPDRITTLAQAQTAAGDAKGAWRWVRRIGRVNSPVRGPNWPQRFGGKSQTGARQYRAGLFGIIHALPSPNP